MIFRFWDELDKDGVRVILMDQGIDTSTPVGRLQRTMLAAIAEFERETMLERTRDGVARARANGKRFGRPPKSSESQRAEIRSRLSNGQSLRSIAMAMGISASTIRWIRRSSRMENVGPIPVPVSPQGTGAGR